MTTLNEWNMTRLRAHESLEDQKRPHPNGIECPDCNRILWDSSPMVTLASYPSQKNVHCPECGYRGYRIK